MWNKYYFPGCNLIQLCKSGTCLKNHPVQQVTGQLWLVTYISPPPDPEMYHPSGTTENMPPELFHREWLEKSHQGGDRWRCHMLTDLKDRELDPGSLNMRFLCVQWRLLHYCKWGSAPTAHRLKPTPASLPQVERKSPTCIPLLMNSVRRWGQEKKMGEGMFMANDSLLLLLLLLLCFMLRYRGRGRREEGQHSSQDCIIFRKMLK